MARHRAQADAPEDATIADILDDLDDATDYIGRVLERMERCKRLRKEANGRINVRIGIGARPRCPNYMIEYGEDGVKFAAHSGSTNRELSPRQMDVAANWSSRTMHIDAVAALLDGLNAQRD